MARVRNPLCLALLGCALWALGPLPSPEGWLAPSSRPSSIARRAAGFGDTTPASRKRRKPVYNELKQDHGDKASLVEDILNGKPAPTPEDMVRARYSACRMKDAVFMAKTEKNALQKKMSNRVRAWCLCFGTEQPDSFDAEPGSASKLQELERLEIIEASDKEVEFKLHCKRGVLHERSVMEEDDKYGWIYSGESKMDDWQ
mmetsp:Transcript_27791/g.52153  ORF Transcript_27791/g.52153 Transcript_27791/m.52153 type:complete len:201 (+) Transcript_27791:66-668(+)